MKTLLKYLTWIPAFGMMAELLIVTTYKENYMSKDNLFGLFCAVYHGLSPLWLWLISLALC